MAGDFFDDGADFRFFDSDNFAETFPPFFGKGGVLLGDDRLERRSDEFGFLVSVFPDEDILEKWVAMKKGFLGMGSG